MARPSAKIDWNEVDEMLKIQCTGVEIAEELGINPETLYDACKRDHKIGFSEYSQQKRAKGVTHARKQFYNQCWIDDGDDRTRATKQIFWLKNHAGMSDKQDINQNVTASIKNVVFELPDNKTANSGLEPLPPGWDEKI